MYTFSAGEDCWRKKFHLLRGNFFSLCNNIFVIQHGGCFGDFLFSHFYIFGPISHWCIMKYKCMQLGKPTMSFAPLFWWYFSVLFWIFLFEKVYKKLFCSCSYVPCLNVQLPFVWWQSNFLCNLLPKKSKTPRTQKKNKRKCTFSQNFQYAKNAITYKNNGKQLDLPR